MTPTPTENRLKMRTCGFATLVEALEYAAQGDTGFNFYSGNGQLQDVLTYTLLKKKAQAIAGRLRALGLERGARVAHHVSRGPASPLPGPHNTLALAHPAGCHKNQRHG